MRLAVALALSLECVGAFVAPLLLRSTPRGGQHGSTRGRAWRLPAVRMQVNEPEFVTIDMGAGRKEEKLPLSMVSGFQTWIKADNELRPLFNSDSVGEEPGWVDPVSFSELWLPQDLPQPLVRPALTALVKDGVIRYIMPGLDVSVQAAGKLWWNRGLNSFPLPSSWASIGGCDLSKLRMVAFTQSGYKEAEQAVKQVKEGEEYKEEEELTPWTKIWQTNAQESMVNLVEILADSCGEVLESGFHIVIVPNENEILMPAPEAGTRLKVLLTDSPFEALIKGEEAGALGEIEHDGAVLDILCRRVSAGGSSEYLPEVYKELYASTLQ